MARAGRVVRRFLHVGGGIPSWADPDPVGSQAFTVLRLVWVKRRLQPLARLSAGLTQTAQRAPVILGSIGDPEPRVGFVTGRASSYLVSRPCLHKMRRRATVPWRDGKAKKPSPTFSLLDPPIQNVQSIRQNVEHRACITTTGNAQINAGLVGFQVKDAQKYLT